MKHVHRDHGYEHPVGPRHNERPTFKSPVSVYEYNHSHRIGSDIGHRGNQSHTDPPALKHDNDGAMDLSMKALDMCNTYNMPKTMMSMVL